MRNSSFLIFLHPPERTIFSTPGHDQKRFCKIGACDYAVLRFLWLCDIVDSSCRIDFGSRELRFLVTFVICCEFFIMNISDVVEAFEKVDYNRVVYPGTKAQVYGFEFGTIVSKFGTLMTVHDQTLDDLDIS